MTPFHIRNKSIILFFVVFFLSPFINAQILSTYNKNKTFQSKHQVQAPQKIIGLSQKDLNDLSVEDSIDEKIGMCNQ